MGEWNHYRIEANNGEIKLSVNGKQVTALVEWPLPLAGRFEERFLTLPRELLVDRITA